MKHFTNLFSRYKYELILFGIWVILFITNHARGTFLAGWDNLQTELYPEVAIKRAFYSVWQEYQSFGLVAGMGHASDLIRSILLYFASFIIPQSLIRYSFHLSMIAVGGFGMLRLLQFVGFSKDKKVFAFLGALFYIFNFSVIQMLALPYEAFSVFAGMLPWELWIFLRVITEKKVSAKSLLLLLLINILATPQGVAQQLFVVYGLLLGLLGIGVSISSKQLATFKRAFVAGILILIVNSFWVMPQVYFLITSDDVVRESKINQISTQDVFYSNKSKGNLIDFLSFQGFFYDREGKTQQPLFLPWKEYRETPVVTAIIFLFAAIYLIGLIHKNPFKLAFALCLLLITTALLSNTPPFTWLNSLIRSNSFVNQIFRSPFTKFSIPYAIVGSVFFTFGLYQIALWIDRLDKKYRHNQSPSISRSISQSVSDIDRNTLKRIDVSKYRNSTWFCIIIFFLLLATAVPGLRGNYIASEMKVQIPKEYFEAIDYFKKVDKNKRIALLPEYTFWGWFYHTWGYNGSGFLWYGVEQPIISRTFDVWSFKSESYFWEVKTALEAEDIRAFEQVLEKYHIDYIVFDRSVIPVISSIRGIQYDRLSDLLAKSNMIKKEKKWGNFLTLYKVNYEKKVNNFVSLSSALPNVGPAVALTNNDTAYELYGDYVTNPQKPYNGYFPFLDFTSQTRVPHQKWVLRELEHEWEFVNTLPVAMKDHIPSLVSSQQDINLYSAPTGVRFVLPYTIQTDKNMVSVHVPKVLIKSFDTLATNVEYCSYRKDRKGTLETEKQNGRLMITVMGGANSCNEYQDIYLDQRYGYIVKVRTQNTQGQRPFFYVLDLTKEQPFLEDRIGNDREYYIIGPKYQYGIGYAYTFQNNSYPSVNSSNSIDEVSTYIIPHDVMKYLFYTDKKSTLPQPARQLPVEAKKLQYYLYTVKVPEKLPKDSVLALYQAYHEGWKAYRIENGKLSSEARSGSAGRVENWMRTHFPFWFGKELTPHVPINNWANGWILNNVTMKQSSNETIILIFWPQYIEFFGFFLMSLPFIGLLIWKLNGIKVVKLLRPKGLAL